jgi:tetratricopeptide (TPR) repeat protein
MMEAERLQEQRPWRMAGIIATLGIALSVPLYLAVHALRGPRETAPPEALYVGSQSCAPCHKPEFEKWKGSHHALAMLPPRPDTVLGNFADATFDDAGQVSRFTARGGKYFVTTEGPDGKPHEYEVAYAFGWFPLQQYLIAFPGGRLQCLTVAWDVPKKRWFSLYPGQNIATTDWLHWTRSAANWNTMCSECHSTAVRKRYDVATDTFQTTWSEIAVGCESCHGPGSLHDVWAKKPAMARPALANAGFPVKTKDMSQREVVDLCMPCHARRSELKDLGVLGGEPLDSMLPVTLAEGLYYPDGQIQDEDYEYHSFLQSKMYEKGVKCSDCHDVHAAKRYKEGNELCLKCHRADTYDQPSHHFHKKVVEGKPSAGALCVSCHMPGRNYMVVHFRRDHSLRVPRPDLSAQLGTPNACTQSGCHDDKPLAWSVTAFNKWYGEKRKPHWGAVIAAARAHKPEARAELLHLASDPLRPAIVRATALDLMWAYPGADTDAIYQKALMDGDALIRRTAVSHTDLQDSKAFVKRLAPMLKDPVLAVRTEAAFRLSEVPPNLLTESQAKDLKAAAEELQQTLAFAADMPSGRYNLGIQAQNRGEAGEAEKQYRKALEFDDQFYLARVNLALLLNQQGRNAEAEALLTGALKTHPRDPSIAFNLGLLLAEEGKDKEAQAALRIALEADPTLAPAAYNLAVLVGKEKPAEAVELSRRAATLNPAEPKYAFTYAYYQVQTRDAAGAERTMEALLKAHPAFGEGYLFLARLYASQGKVEPARELLRKALSVPELSAEDKKSIEGALGQGANR